MRRELLLISHYTIIVEFTEVILDQLTVVAFSYEHLPYIHSLIRLQVDIVQRRVGEY